MTKTLIYQGYGYIGFRFPNLDIGATMSPPNARLFDSYDNLLLPAHRLLAQIATGASGEYFAFASVRIFAADLHTSSLLARPGRARIPSGTFWSGAPPHTSYLSEEKACASIAGLVLIEKMPSATARGDSLDLGVSEEFADSQKMGQVISIFRSCSSGSSGRVCESVIL